MSLGDNLRTLIDEQDMTQKEVARQLNIAPSTLGSYIQDKREPDFATLKALAEYFHVSIDYLMDYSFEKETSHQEDELMRILQTFSEKEKELCIEQCKVLVRLHHREK